MSDIRSQEDEWTLGKARQLPSGLWIREVLGYKKMPNWKHEPDRRIEISTDGKHWIAPTMYDSMVILERYRLNEDRLYPLPKHHGGEMVCDMLEDFRKLGAWDAYDKWVEEPRRQRRQRQWGAA